jgi:RNA polymerase sigma factor (sigma-70 family)
MQRTVGLEDDGAWPLDAQERFVCAVRNTPPLSPEEEARLWAFLAADDAAARRSDRSEEFRAARERLVTGYQPIIYAIAKRYAWRCRVLSTLDLAQEGTVGLLEAIHRATPVDRSGDGVPAVAYRAWACAWIRGAMLAALARCEGAMRLPARKIQAITRLHAVRAELLSQLGHEPTVHDLSERMDVPMQGVRELIALDVQHAGASLDVGDPHADRHAPCLARSLTELGNTESGDGETSAFVRLVREFVACLPDRDRHVIALRYGFGGSFGRDRARSQTAVAALLGVPLTTVQEIDRRVRLGLRRALAHSSQATQAARSAA